MDNSAERDNIMQTIINPKDCPHIGGVKFDNIARNPGTQNQEPFVMVRCESCNQIVSVVREDHLESKFQNVFRELGKMESALARINTDLTGVKYGGEKTIKTLLEEISKKLDKLA